MSTLQETIDLDPREEADRLWQGARDARRDAAGNLVALFECLNLGIRVAEILTIERLQSVRNDFPATIAQQLEKPSPVVEAYRDAVTTPKSLEFTESLDLLSGETLDCVGPRLHRGWEDRAFSCRRSRATSRTAVDVSLDAPSRDRLLLLAAYRNRVFRYPPPLRVVPAEILAGLDELARLVEQLRA